METKIIKVVFGGRRYAVTAKRTRTDYGQAYEFVDLALPETFECIFSNSATSAGTGKKMIGTNQRCLIPDEYLKNGQTIYAWILLHDDEDDGRHMYSIKTPVDDMPDTSPEEPTPVEQSVISQAITALNSAVDTTTQKAQEASASADRAEQAAEGVEGYVERAESAQQAAESARDRATQAETNARTSAATASEKASEAISSATTASQSALTAESASESASASADASYQNAETAYRYAQDSATSARQASSYADDASEYAQTASQKATEASQKASEASQSASTAVQAKTDAITAKTASETAQGLAESARDEAITAKTYAESARSEAQDIVDGITNKVAQIDSNTERIESLEDDRYKPYPTDTVFGSIASFPDGADDIPLKSCIVQVNPVQEGSGDPSPDNIRPISGWTGCEIVRANANLWNDDWYALGNVMSLITDETDDFYGYYNGYVKRWDNAQIENGNEHLFQNGVDRLTVTFEAGCVLTGSGFTFRVFFHYTDGTEDSAGGNATLDSREKRTVVRASTIGKKCTGFRISTIAGIGNSGGAIRRIMVSANDNRDIITPVRTTYPITFPSEAGVVYGAYIDVINGVLTVERVAVIYDGTEGYSNSYFPTVLCTKELPTGKGGGNTFLCSHLPTGTYYADFSNSVKRTIQFGHCDTVWNVASANELKAKIAEQYANGTPVTFVYELAEPIHYPLTPQEITSLLGQNNLWANTGDTEVEYRADTKLYIERLTAPDSADMIADANITSGQYFMVGNSLYKATANIANGGAIIVGTNCTRVSLAQALNEINA